MAAVFVLLGCQTTDEHWRPFSIAPKASRLAQGSFPNTDAIQLERVFTIGELQGTSEATFTAISAVAVDKTGSVFVADPRERRIVVFDSLRRFVRTIGRAGSGPGEFTAPVALMLFADSLLAFDRGLLRASVFSKGGEFRRAFALDRPHLESLAADARTGFLIAEASPSGRAARYSLTGALLARYRLAAEIDADVRGNWIPSPGAICGVDAGRTYLIANPWILELVAVDTLGNIRWARRWRSSVLVPQEPDLPNVSPKMQGAVILGLVCTDDLVVLGYLDRRTQRIYYDFFTAQGTPLARRTFSSDTTAEYPGRPAALVGSLLVTYRNRPYPQVFGYHLRER